MTKDKHKYLWMGEADGTSNVYNERPNSLSNTLDRTYDKEFKATEEYISTISDLQNGPAANIQG